MSVVTKFTDYSIFVPDWILRFVREEINLRDIGGVLPNRGGSVAVGAEHPLVMLVGSVLQSGKADFQGVFPRISVVEGDEDEESTPLGQGIQDGILLDETSFPLWMEQFRIGLNKTMKERKLDGVVTDGQLAMIETAWQQNGYRIAVHRQAYWERETAFISLWGNTLEERQVLGKVLRSVLYDMRIPLAKAGGHDIKLSTARGLVNFDFGRLLYGEETSLSFLNRFTTYTVDTDTLADNLTVSVDGKFVAVGHAGELPVNVEGETVE